MTRDEHLAWCKKRAVEELNYNSNCANALISMLSDLGKHEETKNHSGIKLTTMLMLIGKLKNREEVLKHIAGFN